MIISGALGLGGLSAVFLDDSRFRSIGIVGYAGVFPNAALLIAILFYRAVPAEVRSGAAPLKAMTKVPLQ